MKIPTIKTLITYTYKDSIKKVLCDLEPLDLNDSYERIDYEQFILSMCPFDAENNYHKEIYNIQDNIYEIMNYDYHEPTCKVYVIVNHVLEFNGRVFLLQEVQYDLRDTEIY